MFQVLYFRQLSVYQTFCHEGCSKYSQEVGFTSFLSRGPFTNYVDKILASFDHLPPCVDIFYGINVDKKWTFLDHLPTSSCKRSLWTTPNIAAFSRDFFYLNYPEIIDEVTKMSVIEDAKHTMFFDKKDSNPIVWKLL